MSALDSFPTSVFAFLVDGFSEGATRFFGDGSAKPELATGSWLGYMPKVPLSMLLHLGLRYSKHLWGLG